MKQHRSMVIGSPELELLLACTGGRPQSEIAGNSIRRLLATGIDWTVFTRMAIRQGLAGLADRSLARTAPDMVPEDLLVALRMNTEQVRRGNRVLLDELGRLAESLARDGIEAIAFKGPALGLRAYGDLALRTFGNPAFLVRPTEIGAATASLREPGYERRKQLTEAQLDLIRYLEGHETLFNPTLRTHVELHIRLVPLKMMLDIDHEGLWRRARPTSLNDRIMLTLAPEDELLTLAIRDGSDTSWTPGWACDVANIIRSHPDLDWQAVIERARAAGYPRMLLGAVALACNCFDTDLPAEIHAMAHADPVIEAMVLRTVAHWQSDQEGSPPADKTLSMDLLRLHDGLQRKVGYVARSWFLPSPPHVSRIRLPQRLTRLPMYVPIKIAQDAAMLPLLRTYRKLHKSGQRLRDVLAVSLSAEQRTRLNRHKTSRAAARQMLTRNPNDLVALRQLGDAYLGLRRYESAIVCYDKALAISPEDSGLWTRRAAALSACGGQASRLDVDRESVPDPKDADAWARRAAFLAASRRFAEAVEAADRALAAEPGHLLAKRIGIRCRIVSCDWRRRDDDEQCIAQSLRAGVRITTPAGNRAISDSEAQNLLAARLWIRPFVQAEPLWRGEKYRHDRIRLAYLCSEFHDHPVGRQVVGVFESHDRGKFEIAAISLAGPDPSAIRHRLETACDRFVSVHDMNDQQTAAMIRDMEIDIAIDLDRLAARARPGILARRPAPVQISYFGNAGTTGAPFFDYIVADRTLIPSQHFCHYTEQVIWLPNSYQCNDATRYIPPSTPSRAEAGLPDAGFVFCCFNNNYKISPPVFDVWMRLLGACPGSVLWLLGKDPYSMHNLRREAAARSIAPERLVFAPFVPNDQHMARHRLADLFLDTLPCNAHATASDALWGGIPILTCLGNTFAGRVGASLLRAVGLPEMVTTSLAEYEELALSLARDPQRLGALRARLAHNRQTEPLFDTQRLTRDLETAYTAVWRRQQAGLVPEALMA